MIGEPAFTDARILIVDDQEANVMLLERLLEQGGYTNVDSTTQSSKVVELCAETQPDLLMLDLQMPAPDGIELLGMLAPWLEGKAYLPVLVLTADVTPETKRRALSAGARDFLTKPFDPSEVLLRVSNLLRTRDLQLQLETKNEALAIYNGELEWKVRERTRHLEEARLEVLDRLAIAAEFRDDTTHEHAQRIGRSASLLAAELGVDAETAVLIGRAAPLHDVGKIGVSDTILLKPAKLSADEFELMKMHTVIGGQILNGSRSPLLQLSAEIALSHHERWDGSGYPAGAAGETIPLSGRIVALADVFDALTHQRPYKQAWPLEDALAEIRAGSGTQFDRRVVEAFEALDHEALLAPIATDDLLAVTAA